MNTDRINQANEEIVLILNRINDLKDGITAENADMYVKSIDIMLKDVHLAIMRHYYREDMIRHKLTNDIQDGK